MALCKCKYEPRGSNGLEGFILNNNYRFKLINYGNKRYVRIYLSNDYYERCGIKIFQKYFTQINNS